MKLYKDYAVLASGQIASRLLGLLAFAWLARVLAPETYGAVEYVIGIALLGGTFIDGGSSLVGARRATQEPEALPRIAFQVLVARLVLAALSVPIVAGLALWTAGPAVPTALIWLFAASLLLTPWRQEWIFQATGRIANVALGQTLRACVFALLVFASVRAAHEATAVGWCELAAGAALTAYCLYVQHRRITPVRWAGSLRGFASVLRESLAAGAGTSAWAIGQSAPLLMIGALVGGVQTAWFAAAARIVGSLMIVPYVYHYGLYPAVSRAVAHDIGELRDLLARSCRVAAWGGVLLALALALLAEPVVTLVMGPKFGPAAAMLRVMAWVIPVSLCSDHASSALAAAGQQTKIVWTQLARLGTVIVVGLLLGDSAGGLGYAIAALAGAFVVWGVVHFFAQRRGLHPPAFLLTAKPAALAAAILVAAQLTQSGPWTSLAWLAGYAALAPIVDRKLIRDFFALGRASPGLRGASTRTTAS